MNASESVTGTLPTWSTSSFGNAMELSKADVAALKKHLDHCNSARGSLFALRCAGETMHALLRGRLMTIVATVVLVMGVCAFVF